METNIEGLEHLLEEDNVTIVEDQQQHVDVPIGEHTPIIPNASGSGPRSIVWPEYIYLHRSLRME